MGRGRRQLQRGRGTASSQPELVLVLLEALNGESDVPVIVSDLRAAILEAKARKVPLGGLDQLDGTDLFTLLSGLASRGDVEREERGYVVSESGRQSAQLLRAQQPRLRQLDDAALVAFNRSW